MSSTAAAPSERILSKSFRDAGRPDIVKWDVFPVRDGERIVLTFEGAKAGDRHGVSLMTDIDLEVNGAHCRIASLWHDTSPAVVDMAVHTADGRLHVYNIWDSGTGRNSQAWTSGMLVEELPNGRRYRCNDIGLAGAFDSVVFRLERVGNAAVVELHESPSQA